MKSYILPLLVFVVTLLFAACDHKTDPSLNTTINETPDTSAIIQVTDENSPAESSIATSNEPQNTDQIYVPDKYFTLGGIASREAITFLFNSSDLDDIIKTLGEPDKKEDINGSVRWYFSNGIEVDVVSVNDYLEIENYVYLSNECELYISKDIGIGSTYDQVVDAYIDSINYNQTNDNMIVVGRDDTGIVFLFENEKVNSIFISTDSFTQNRHDLISNRS